MATLDDRILGEKLHYYCSSSEDEDENEGKAGKNGEDNENEKSIRGPAFIPEHELRDWEGSSVNTGPKGVLKDWQRYKQLQTEKREEQDKEKVDLIKKLSLTCRSHLTDEQEKKEKEELDGDLKELLDDEFLKEYMQNRMEEMIRQIETRPSFGKLQRLNSGQQFLDAVDKEKSDITVIIHIYTEDSRGCEAMNGCLQCLAQEYPHVKFCTVEASSAGMSAHFERNGVPALLVYKKGILIGNFIRLTDEFGDDFFAVDVESFLVEHGFLPDHSLVPPIIHSSTANGNAESDTDSDFDVE